MVGLMTCHRVCLHTYIHMLSSCHCAKQRVNPKLFDSGKTDLRGILR